MICKERIGEAAERPPEGVPTMVNTLSDIADRDWRWFRRLSTWIQVVGWLIGFWLLILVLLWRTPWSGSLDRKSVV